MSTWLIPRAELTPEQLRAVELSPSENRVILGGPGSGKTQILLHRAKFLADHFRVTPDRFRVLVYTKVLKHYIESAFPLLDLPSENVLTFDDWCLNWHKANIRGRTPWNAEEKRPDFEAIRRAVTERLTAVREPLFDFVLVDEGQDLEPEVFKLLRAISRHVTVCLDHKQQIYDHRSSEAMILAALGVRKRNINLLEGFRCSPYLVRLAAELIDDVEERESFTNQGRVAPRQKETPLLRYTSGDEEIRRLDEVIRERQLVGDRIAILFPTQRKLYGFAKALRERGLDLETQKELDFGTGKPKMITYYSAKGLTFDTVLMPRLVNDSAWKMMEARAVKLLFVGITRATRWAYFSATEAEQLTALRRLLPLVGRGDLTVQRAGGDDGPAPASDSTKSPKSGPDLGFL
ncbi:MAG: UvrD-helicase domain-containing protein [Chthoniobacter sp.]|uniref:UvrD-helicase domain-containing protein n=1 Tax=Chthoniobacter sp. TaxID=2510640 RepID=UPI0032A34378